MKSKIIEKTTGDVLGKFIGCDNMTDSEIFDFVMDRAGEDMDGIYQPKEDYYTGYAYNPEDMEIVR